MRCYIYKLGLICVLLSGIVDRCFARSFSVQRVGDGKQAVILIPGFACSGEVWKQTADTLRNDYTCYVLTMPGFAGIAPEADPSFDNWAKEIVDFIRSESIDRPILIGHSMGGGLALKIASAQENLVKKADCSNIDYMNRLLEIKRQEHRQLHIVLDLYFMFLSSGFSLYIYEYTFCRSSCLGIVAYSLLFLWISINWFVFRPYMIRKRNRKFSDLIKNIEDCREQLLK